MTHRYAHMNQHDALYTAARAYPGGIEGLAQRMHVSPHVLRNKLAPSCKTHHITFEEASLIVEYLTEAKVDDAKSALMAMSWRHHLAAYEIPAINDLEDDELSSGIFNVTKELGDVARVMQESLKDKGISPAELDRTTKEVQELMAASARLLALYQERFDRQGGHLRIA